MSQLTLLQKLQTMDDNIRTKKLRLGEVLQEMKEPETLLQARVTDKDTDAALKELQRSQRELELQHGTLSSKYQASHDRMYSGKVTNSRELSDLEKEVTSLKKRRGLLEDEMLENMMSIEEATEARVSAETNLERLETGFKDSYATLNNEKLELATVLNDLLGKRKAHASKIEAKHLRIYMDIAKKRRGSVIATLERDQCGACRMKVSMATIKSVNEGQITYCGSCGRILS